LRDCFDIRLLQRRGEHLAKALGAICSSLGYYSSLQSKRRKDQCACSTGWHRPRAYALEPFERDGSVCMSEARQTLRARATWHARSLLIVSQSAEEIRVFEVFRGA